MDGRQTITPIAALRRTTRRLAACTAAASVALLATAGASQAEDASPATRFAVGSPAMQVAQQIAAANWGTQACGGRVTVEWGADEANINARSYWANPFSSYDAPEHNTQCRIVFNASMSFTWPKFCTVLVHEYGHLTGRPHTTDGPDVMSPIYRAPLPACTDAEPAAAAPTPAPAPEPAPAIATPAPASTVVTTPTPRATKRAKARAKDRAGARAKARKASARKRHTNADMDFPLPWAPFSDVLDHAADPVLVVHEVEPLVDLVQGDAV